MHSRILQVITAILLSSTAMLSKCPNSFIYVEGSINRVANGDKITVLIDPDPNWEPQSPVTIENGKFAAQILFNTTKSERRFGDACSRIPKTATVFLFRNGHEVDRVELRVSRDFLRDKAGDYKLHSPVTLHAAEK
jgi:hypothetical protein